MIKSWGIYCVVLIAGLRLFGDVNENDYLYSASFLDGETRCPEGYLKIYISNDGVDVPESINSSLKPMKTLYYAWKLIGDFESETPSLYLGYCVLLKRGNVFFPYNYVALDASLNECVNDGSVFLIVKI